jgi:hypothetical protein
MVQTSLLVPKSPTHEKSQGIGNISTHITHSQSTLSLSDAAMNAAFYLDRYGHYAMKLFMTVIYYLP